MIEAYIGILIISIGLFMFALIVKPDKKDKNELKKT